jgi:hypothetical protein
MRLPAAVLVTSFALLPLTAPALAAAPLIQPQSDTAAITALAKRADGALVTVKHILKVEGGGEMGAEEEESELTAVMIEPTGLVLCANSVLLGQAGLMARFQPEAGISVTPTDVKVLIGDDTEGVKARVLSRDTDLDLAWLQIDEPSTTPYTFVDLHNAAAGDLGQPVLTAARLGKFFDRTLVLEEGHVLGKTTKPRDLFIASGISTQPGSPSNRAGMPVFATDGKVLGIAVLQLPAAEDLQAGSGDGSEYRGYDRMVLPAAEVLKATERTKELAASGEAPADAEPTPDAVEAPAGGEGEPK